MLVALNMIAIQKLLNIIVLCVYEMFLQSDGHGKMYNKIREVIRTDHL
jgi:hypothetical protein